jgi:hypothetical protein
MFVGHAGPSYAQVCREAGGSGAAPANMNCDMRYRNTEVSCDAANIVNSTAFPVTGTRASCPRKPMPMIDTPKASYLSDYSKYLYIYPRDGRDDTIPYVGPYTVGTPGDPSRTFQMIGNTARGTKRLASCTTQLQPPAALADDAEWARFIRLQVDNCANQYVLNGARGPFQKENTRILAMDADPYAPGARLSRKIDLDSECQPLRMVRDTTNEYDPLEYLRAAWTKTLIDPTYRKSTATAFCAPRDLANIAASRALGQQVPYDHEPHLPCSGRGNQGIRIENPLTIPPDLQPTSGMTLAEISAVQYEQIVDPTHPYSPRWDYLYSDRDYSAPYARAAIAMTAGGSTAGLIAIFQAAGRQYMTQSGFENSSFCAGIKEARNETDATRKKNLEVKVDVLAFRRDAYDNAIRRRGTYNLTCYLHRAPFTSGNDAFFYVYPLSFCWQITGYSYFYPWIYARDFDCWDCFGLSGRVDDESQHPPCTHNYLGRDLRMRRPPGGLNRFSRVAQCGTPMDRICRDLRKPFTPLNKLKMRYHNPTDPNDTAGNNVVLKDGELEGLSFNDYFDNHMPYPRIWDLGQSLQTRSTSDSNNQPPLDTTGQFTTIVGVGREAAATVASNAAPADANGQRPADRYLDQRCKTMGWSGVPNPLGVSFGGLSVYTPDPLTSWTELKLYQARTQRNVGLTCIGRYEKVFKPGSAENMILATTGAEWERTIISRCNRGARGTVDKASCTFMTLQEYETAGSPPDSATVVYLKQVKSDLWPNAWRGYLTAADPEARFPNFGSAGATMKTRFGGGNALAARFRVRGRPKLLC